MWRNDTECIPYVVLSWTAQVSWIIDLHIFSNHNVESCDTVYAYCWTIQLLPYVISILVYEDKLSFVISVQLKFYYTLLLKELFFQRKLDMFLALQHSPKQLRWEFSLNQKWKIAFRLVQYTFFFFFFCSLARRLGYTYIGKYVTCFYLDIFMISFLRNLQNLVITRKGVI